MKDYYENTKAVFNRYNAVQEKIQSHSEETNAEDDEFLQNFCIYFAHALIKDTGYGAHSREELTRICDVVLDVIR